MIIADTHVHIYPRYDLELLFRSAFENLSKLGDAKYLLCLTERSECHFYADQITLGAHRSGAFEINVTEKALLRVHDEKSNELLILPGRQIATAERIEVLGLGTDETLPDGTPAQRCIEFFNEKGAVVILPWSLGKWFGARGKLVQDLIADRNLSFLLGDPAHRPIGIPESPRFAEARNAGRKILCGTDPLPLPGEERRVGKYASLLNGDDPLLALKDPHSKLGKRFWPWETALKILELKKEAEI